MIRNAATLRATREMLGLSQADLAGMSRVDVRSVKRWERGDGTAPDVVWGLLARLKARADEIYDATLDMMEESCLIETALDAGGITLTYFRTQEEFDEREPGSGVPYSFMNAVTARVAGYLEDAGADVGFVYPGESPANEAAYEVRKEAE